MHSLHEEIHRISDEYSGSSERPLGGYLVAMVFYGGFTGVLAALAVWRRRTLPARPSFADTMLISLATHKLSRLIAKDAVTSPLRAPFARYDEPAGAAELNEHVPDGRIKHAVGELISCPFCLAVWVATAFTGGLVLAPRFTRLVASTLTSVAISDTLQLVYDAAKQLPSRAARDS